MLGELSITVNPTLREKNRNAIAGKLINAKVNFELDAPIKNLLMTMQRNSVNQSLEIFREGEST